MKHSILSPVNPPTATTSPTLRTLAEKYACQGPRYTSYPTAPNLQDADALEAFRQRQHNPTNDSISPLSLYVHIPFCRDICYYCACNKIVTRDETVAQRYLASLDKEIQLQSAIVGKSRPITQLHWGGGTPTYLGAPELTQLMHSLASNFHLLDDDSREYAIEIDPRTITGETLALLKGLGFNRISLGIQDFDPLVQKAVNRQQPFEMIAKLVDAIRSLDFRSLSFDLIYGLPHQDQTSISNTLDKVIQLRPDRIACYNYAHLPERFSSQRSIDRLDLPTPEARIDIHMLICEKLQAGGYSHIGMDHFALPEDELSLAQSTGNLQRNFQGYSLRMAEDTLGIGISAISQIDDCYSQNERDIENYYEHLDSGQLPTERAYNLNAEDKLRRHIIMRLICDLKLDIAQCNTLFGIDFNPYFASLEPALEDMIRDGLITRDTSQIAVTETGRLFLRNICMLFDAYLENGKNNTRFSATV
jgi:oxygen-independent coproporphyrinogen III oxidase